MGIALASWLLATALMAPGDIYRCKDASGAVSFQDQPCTGGESAHLARAGDDPADSERALRQWLDAYRGRNGDPASTPAPAAARPPRWQGGGAISEAQLAMCSERFLHCASGDAAAMDACIARLPSCGSGAAGACCPRSCVARYQDLREAGHALASAVRLALLDPDAPACGQAPALR